MNELLILAALTLIHYLATWWIVRRDMRRLPPKKLARCWNGASFGSAVLAFGPLCIVVHFIKGHGWLKGPWLGIAWTFVAMPDVTLALVASMFV